MRVFGKAVKGIIFEKKSFFFFAIVVILFSCTADNRGQSDEIPTETISTQSNDQGADRTVNSDPKKYFEHHPNGQIKIQGKFNENGNRHGLWMSFYDNGTKWSESYYVDGKKDGHSLTFFPNGQIRYLGEYKNDLRVGNWKFYNEEGNVVNEENF